MIILLSFIQHFLQLTLVVLNYLLKTMSLLWRKYFFVWFLNFMYFVAQKSFSSASVHERNLYNDLFKSYTPLERPVNNNDEKVVVNFTPSVMQLSELDVQQQVLVMSMWLTFGWNDANLLWNQSEYGNISSIKVPPNKIWIPDILMYNNADDGFNENNQGIKLIVQNDGNCSYILPGLFKSTCKIDTTWFPFDEQKCNMKFGSWVYDGSELDLQVEHEEGDMSSLIENEEWQIISFKSRRNEMYYFCCPEPYVDVTFTLHIKRKSSRYYCNTILPSSIVAFCGLFVFFIPPESGSKLTFGVTILAMLYICQNNFAEFRTSSTVPLIQTYLSCLISMILMSLVASIFVLNIHYSTSTMPKWIRSLFIDILPRLLLMKKYRKGIGKSNNVQADIVLKEVFKNPEDIGCGSTVPENESPILFELQNIREMFRQDKSVDEMRNDWKFVAKVWNRMFFVVFQIFFIVVIIKMWMLQ